MRSPKDGRGGRAARLLASVTASCVLAAGFVAAPVAGLPWNAPALQTRADAQHGPDVGAGSRVGEGVSVGVIGASRSTGPTTLQEVLDVLERAELAAQDAGRSVTPQVEQAAAELGMLLSTYLAQQAAVTSDRPFAQVGHALPAPVVPAPGTTLPGTTTQAEEPTAVPVARQVSVAPAADHGPNLSMDPSGTAPQAEDATTHEGGRVTFDDVVVAATRLATLLDPATTTLAAGILPAGADGTVAARATLTASLLEVVDRYGRSTAGYANGRIPTSALCPLDFAPGHLLRCDAAQQLSALSEEYEREFGVPIPMTDSYRTLESQVRLKATKGWLAATPGTSNHGWGLAVDLGSPISTGTSAEYVWMRVHAPDYGWDNPSWARLTGSKPEPWHFEFFAAGPVPDRAWKADDVAAGGGPQAPAERADGSKGADQDRDDPAKGSAGKKTGEAAGEKKDSGKKSGQKDSQKDAHKKDAHKKDAHKKGSDQKGSDQKGDGGTGGSKDGSTPKPGTGDGDEPEKPVTTVTVPDVTGQTRAAAVKKLESLGLRVVTKERPDAKAPEGTVLSTRGAGTKVAKGSTVTLVVSSGPELVEVPDVTDLTVGEATARLEELGFVVVTDPAEGVEADDLVVETRGAGTSVPKGSTVVLAWSAADDEPEQVTVPDVVGEGLTPDEAQAVLADAGLDWAVVEEESAEHPEGTVLWTDPEAGTQVDAGSTVTIGVSTGAGE